MGIFSKKEKRQIILCKNNHEVESGRYKQAFYNQTNNYNSMIKSSVVEAKEWFAGAGDKACHVCKKNQEVGAIPLKDLFPSGHLYPPAGQGCGCSLLPVVYDS